MTRHMLLLTSAASALACATSAFAQDVAEPRGQDTTMLEELVVTAQKRAENLQDVPVAISAFTDKQRDLLGINTAQDIAKFTPGMAYVDFPNRIVLRGVGRVTNSLGSDPGVATYYDGVYNSESWALAQPSLLVERIEVLRGPQGTLYGRNSIGGAINVISKRPTSDFQGQINQTFSSYDSLRTTAFVSGPIAEGLGYRLSGDFSRQPAYVTNLAGGDLGGIERTYLEGQLQAELGSIRAWAKYAYTTQEGSGAPPTRRAPYDTVTFSGLVPNPTFGYAKPSPGLTDFYTVDIDHPGRAKRDNDHQLSTEVVWDLGTTTLKYVGGYAQYSVFVYGGDVDASSRASFTDPVSGALVSANHLNDLGEHKKWWSNELNWSSSGDGPLRWILGLYQYDEKIRQPFELYSPDQRELTTATLSSATFTPLPNPRGDFYFQEGTMKARTFAVYGQADYEFAPNWTVTAGLRYTWDDKEGFETQRIVFFDPRVTPGFALQLTPDNHTRSLENDWSGGTGRLGLQWEPQEDTLVYANISNGYKSGGYNLGQFLDTVGPEHITALEGGLKKTIGGNLQINAAVFYYEYKDLQVLSNFCLVFAGGVCSLSQQKYLNAPEARSYGFEAETIWRPTSQLQLLFNYSFLDAEFRKFSGVANPQNPSSPPLDLAGTSMPLSPRNKVTVNAVYTLDFTPGALSLSGTYAWTDRLHYDLFDTPLYQAKARGEASFRATWRDAEDRFTLIGFVNNAFDEEGFSNLAVVPTGPGTYGRSLTTTLPRIVGVELQVPF